MTIGTKFLTGVGAVVMAAGAVLFAQGGDANKVMADMRQALGGDKVAAVRAVTASGKSTRAMGEKSIQNDYEMALLRPDKYFTKQVVASLPMGNVSLTLGFNGNALIQDTEMPQMPGGGNMFVRVGGAGGAASPNASPAEQAAADAKNVVATKQEYARMALALFAGSPEGYPLTFKYNGVAEAPDGKADVIDVSGSDEFTGKLFVDQKTHLPLMFSWMAKEPVKMQSTSSGGPGTVTSFGGGGGTSVMKGGGGGGSASASSGGGLDTKVQQMTANKNMSKEDIDKMMKDMQAKMAEAEAKAKMVEYRVYYGDFKNADGLNWPHRFQQSIAGEASSELTIEKYKINPKIDEKKFEPKKNDNK